MESDKKDKHTWTIRVPYELARIIEEEARLVNKSVNCYIVNLLCQNLGLDIRQLNFRANSARKNNSIETKDS